MNLPSDTDINHSMNTPNLTLWLENHHRSFFQCHMP